jgi:glycosyltransferase involved in cell wall biosynthesis
VRILFLNDLWDPRIGSSVRQMYQEAAALRSRGHEVAVASATQDRASIGSRGWGETRILGTPVYALWSDYAPRWRGWVGLRNRRVLGPLRELLGAWTPDVVHTHLIHTHLSYAALTLARAAGAGVVFTAHDVMTFCYQKLTCFHGGEEHGGRLDDVRAYWQKCIPCQRLRYNPWRNAAIRRVLARDVDRFTAVSDALAQAIRANDIRVDRTIHNAIEPLARRPDAEAVRAFRARHGLEDRRLIAIGGRLHEQKGVKQLLRMLALLAPRFPDLRLLVMGKREVYEREFAALARELGVAERVVPTGWLDGEELERAYAAVDVFVTPSICLDTFGLVNLEAMQHAKPVVATVFGGSREVVEDGVTGAIENPFDIGRYAERIAELLADPSRARAMGEAGRLRVLERFTIERLTEEFLEEYELAREAARRRGGESRA